VVVEATGAASVVLGALSGTASYGVVCLTGVSPVGHRVRVDAGRLNRELVLENDAVVGSVNANRRHYAAAAEALAGADGDWLRGLITRVLPLEEYAQGFDQRGGEIDGDSKGDTKGDTDGDTDGDTTGDIKTVLALADEVCSW
jgi:threonine dehydrogenase-like Zn-dependent dehydrogenase